MERVNHPEYYNNGPSIKVDGKDVPIECIDVIRDMPTWKGNAIKYLWRAGLKKEEGLSDIQKEIEDLQKAIFYVQDRINILSNGISEN